MLSCDSRVGFEVRADWIVRNEHNKVVLVWVEIPWGMIADAAGDSMSNAVMPHN